MVKKKTVQKKSGKNILDMRVHGAIAYGTLLLLAIVVLIFVYSLQWYIIP
jgi:hypothetical protein